MAHHWIRLQGPSLKDFKDNPNLDPFHRLRSFKSSAKATAKHFLKRDPSLLQSTALGSLFQAIALLREVVKDSPSQSRISDIISRYPQISHLYQPHDYTTSYSLLTKHINDILRQSRPEGEDDLPLDGISSNTVAVGLITSGAVGVIAWDAVGLIASVAVGARCVCL